MLPTRQKFAKTTVLLLVDAGNTRLKWALAASGESAAGTWVASGNSGHDELDALSHSWKDADIHVVMASNVAGASMQARLTQLFCNLNDSLKTSLKTSSTFDSATSWITNSTPALPTVAAIVHKSPVVTWFSSVPNVAGVRNGYCQAHRLGCDRLAAMVGAKTLFPDQPLLVVTCGTATTIDALTADGDFIGGLILPGLGLMATSLAHKTAQLPMVADLAALANHVKQANYSDVFADNTEDAIVRGCLSAQAGAIDRALAAHGNPRCVLSGGAAAWVLPSLRGGVTLVENLVLIGLHTVAITRADRTSDTVAAWSS